MPLGAATETSRLLQALGDLIDSIKSKRFIVTDKNLSQLLRNGELREREVDRVERQLGIIVEVLEEGGSAEEVKKQDNREKPIKEALFTHQVKQFVFKVNIPLC